MTPPHRPRRSARRPVLLALPLAAALLAAAALGCYDEAARDAGPGGRERGGPTEPPPVEALQAKTGTLPLEERVGGVVKARNQVAIRPEISATVVEVMVRSGEAVEAGRTLVRLDDQGLREQLRRAEAELRLAEAEAAEARARVAEVEAQVTRTRALAAQALVPELQLETQEAQLAAIAAAADGAEARVEQARATVGERENALGKTLVKAPVAGRVGQRNAEVGMLAEPGDVLFLIGDLGELIVEVPLTEAMLGRLEAGMPVEISAPALDRPARAELSRISPFLEAESFSTLGEIDLDNPGGRLRPGMFVTVDVLYGETERATLVPAAAVWEDPDTGVVGVWIVDADGGDAAAAAPPETGLSAPLPVALRPVEVVAEGSGAAGVEGVAEGEWVVIVGQHLLGRDDAPTARVRATRWERVAALQELQREDLLRGFLAEQERIAATRGAVPPTSEEFLSGEREGAEGP